VRVIGVVELIQSTLSQPLHERVESVRLLAVSFAPALWHARY
jgi:hypothetical protein